MPSTAVPILDGLSTSVAVKAPCRVATSANISLSGLQTIGAVTVVEDDRVLVRSQTDETLNGIYAASTGSWRRTKDFDGNRDVVLGTIVLVKGDSGDGSIYQVTTENPIVIGTSEITFDLWTDPAATYPQTQVEIDAGVTPANTAYQPGDIRRYDGIGDGATDNTAALKNWAKCAAPGMRLTLEADGVYLYDPFSDAVIEGILFEDAANFVVEGNGAILKAEDGASTGSGRQMMYLRNVQDATFQNFTIDGNRDNRTPVEATCHNLTVSTDTKRITFQKVRSINACCDGFYLDTQDRADQDTWPTDIVFKNDCSSSNSFRNNLSVVNSVRPRISGDYYNANGTAPEDGIDIEPDAGVGGGNIDVIVDDVNVYDNEGWGLSLGRGAGATATNTRPKVSNISGEGNALGFIRFDSVTDGEMDEVHCGPHATATRGMIDLTATAVVNAKLRNLHFHDITATGGTNVCLYVHGGVTGRTLIDGVRIRNSDCGAMSLNQEVDLMNVQVIDCAVDGAIQVFGANSSLKNITVDTCVGRGLYVNAADVETDGLTLIDCASTNSSGHWDNSAVRAVTRNVRVLQRTSIPVGAKALQFDVPPHTLQHVSAKSATTDYTAANIFGFAGGIAGSWISDCVPSATENSGTATIPSGSTSVTFNHGLGVTPAAKDFCITFAEQGTNDYGRWSIGSITSTQATLTVAADPGASNLDVGWNVRVRP